MRDGIAVWMERLKLVKIFTHTRKIDVYSVNVSYRQGRTTRIAVGFGEKHAVSGQGFI